ncbi:PorT family protein [Ferruginibacter lapsinanis]|uniref:outer membrane beta-barrel protein n=1 Tax=Ferruginibacter lapsinanis TaxID=563172 RepID=UPI001E4B010D|nr:outer membrane beta-barrel protein [Ferruginibacter lapsinanis]UEG49917.1 PorT family protein [Ferruginibacter lapsinanis]
MKENLHDIDKLFQSAINQHQESPSDEVWNAIENNLNKKDVDNYRKKNYWLKRLSVLLFLLLTGVSIYLFTKPKNNSHKDLQFTQVIPDRETINEDHNSVLDHQNTTHKDYLTNRNNNQTTNKEIDINDDKIKKIVSIKHTNNNYSNRNKTFEKFPVPVNDKNLSTTTLRQQQKKNKKNTEKKISVKITNASTDDVITTEYHSTSVPEKNNAIENSNSEVPATAIMKVDSSKTTAIIAKKKTVTENGIKTTIKRKTKSEPGLALSAFFSPDFASYNLLNGDNNNQLDGENKDEIEQNEDHQNAFTTGLLFDYTFNKHWAIQTGFTFSKTTIGGAPKKIYAKADNNGNIKYCYWSSSGYAFIKTPEGNLPAVGDSINASSSRHTLQYLSVPLAIKYSIPYKKFEFNLLAGVSANFLIKSKLEAALKDRDEDEHHKQYQIEGLRNVYFSGVAGIGITYNLTSKWGIIFSPSARFALTPINKNIGIRSYSNSIGLTTGVRFKF